MPDKDSLDTLLQTVNPACREFVTLIEELLEKRHANADDPAQQTGRWGPRQWHRTELEDMVYSSYKQMRQGRITRPPRREVVMDIADYLNCSLEERNHLLIAAGTTPVDIYLTGPALAEAVSVAIGVAQNLRLPAVIINRDWRIHYMNAPMLHMYGVTEELISSFTPDQLNVLRLLFDPQLPLQPNLIQNQESWTRMARQTIYGFKRANLFSQFEPWYQDFVSQLKRLPEFETHWGSVNIDTSFEQDPSAQAQATQSVLLETTIPQSQPDPKRAWVRPLLISVGYFQFEFPQIVAFLPADDASRAVFAEVGLPEQ